MCLLLHRRKNLGYLFAIEHGATTVYETDDDNELKFITPPTLPSFNGMEFYVYNSTGELHEFLSRSFPKALVTLYIEWKIVISHSCSFLAFEHLIKHLP